ACRPSRRHCSSPGRKHHTPPQGRQSAVLPVTSQVLSPACLALRRFCFKSYDPVEWFKPPLKGHGFKSALCSPTRMSALGQRQTYAVQQGMSALPPKATSNATKWIVRFGPIAETCEGGTCFLVVWDELRSYLRHKRLFAALTPVSCSRSTTRCRPQGSKGHTISLW